MRAVYLDQAAALQNAEQLRDGVRVLAFRVAALSGLVRAQAASGDQVARDRGRHHRPIATGGEIGDAQLLHQLPPFGFPWKGGTAQATGNSENSPGRSAASRTAESIPVMTRVPPRSST